MINQEILKRTIEKVQASGLMPANACVYEDVHIEDTEVHLHCSIHKDWITIDSADDLFWMRLLQKRIGEQRGRSIWQKPNRMTTRSNT